MGKKKENAPDWVIIYDDLSTFDSTQGDFEDAPAWGIQTVVYQSKETGWSACTGGDYFIRTHDGEFLALDTIGFLDYAANVMKVVKIGRMISRDEFGKAHSLACEIMGDLKKTAHFKAERRE